jgi:hypothetical protein
MTDACFAQTYLSLKQPRPTRLARRNGSNTSGLSPCSVRFHLAYLLLKAQRMAVTKTEFIVLQKVA